jgi:hypothetical protein
LQPAARLLPLAPSTSPLSSPSAPQVASGELGSSSLHLPAVLPSLPGCWESSGLQMSKTAPEQPEKQNEVGQSRPAVRIQCRDLDRGSCPQPQAGSRQHSTGVREKQAAVTLGRVWRAWPAQARLCHLRPFCHHTS